jgi:adenylate kinase family enzyme
MLEALLVLISGSPGAGKTTLGAKIAQELGLPFINKDGIKELLFRGRAAPDAAYSRERGTARLPAINQND